MKAVPLCDFYSSVITLGAVSRLLFTAGQLKHQTLTVGRTECSRGARNLTTSLSLCLSGDGQPNLASRPLSQPRKTRASTTKVAVIPPAQPSSHMIL